MLGYGRHALNKQQQRTAKTVTQIAAQLRASFASRCAGRYAQIQRSSMREKRTPEEIEAVDALSRFIQNIGIENPVELEGWTDNPDVIFNTDSGRIACEIATVVPDTVIQWYFKKLPELPVSSSREIVIPQEPHEWAKRIISAKNKKIDQYKDRAKSRKIWLLIHSSDKTSGVLQPASPTDIELLRYAAHDTAHRFKKILFFDKSGNIVELYDHKNRMNISVNYEFIASGYPTYVLRTVLLGTVSGLVEDVYSEIEIDFSRLPVGDQIVLPPMDERYRRVSPSISMPEKNPKLTIGTKESLNKSPILA